MPRKCISESIEEYIDDVEVPVVRRGPRFLRCSSHHRCSRLRTEKRVWKRELRHEDLEAAHIEILTQAASYKTSVMEVQNEIRMMAGR